MDKKRSEEFGRLLRGAINSIAIYEGKTAPIVEDELGQLIGLSAASIQRYKQGYLPPEPRTLQVFAEAAIRRGFLNREWLLRFLHEARYPSPDQVTSVLCPLVISPVRNGRVYQNLPAATYSRFIMRETAFAEVIEGLAQRSSVVLVISLGGMGKTSLAREVAVRCLQRETETSFDAAVWISDKDHQGTTCLDTVLDEVARTLDYPGFTQFDFDEKRREVEQLLRRQRVLLLVDNFETITDSALVSWLVRLPEPSKVIVTSREYSRAFRSSTSVVDLRGMTTEESLTLIAARLRQLRLESSIAKTADLVPLIEVTGGNPKAIEMALGCVKHERRSLNQVVGDLYEAKGELFDDLFRRCWSLLDEASRRVLLTMPLFRSAVGAQTISAIADVEGYSLVRSIERLTDLSLLDVQQTDLNAETEFTLHPLVRWFAESKLRSDPQFEHQARNRWARFYLEIVSRVGHCPQDLERLDALDHVQDTIPGVMNWLLAQARHDEVIQFFDASEFYYYVRSLWNTYVDIADMAIESAQARLNHDEEIKITSMKTMVLSKQANIEAAGRHIPWLEDLLNNQQDLKDSLITRVSDSIGAYYRNSKDYNRAQQILEAALPFSESLGKDHSVGYRQGIIACLYHKGEFDECRSLTESTLEDAVAHGLQRNIASLNLMLAKISVEQNQTQGVADRLAFCYEISTATKERRYLAIYHLANAKLQILIGDRDQARTSLIEAIDLFERIGIRDNAAIARETLACLDNSTQRA